MMTNETSRFVRWLVIIILTAATVGMFLKKELTDIEVGAVPIVVGIW